MTTVEQAHSRKWLSRRAVIVDASAVLFAKEGYHATSLTQICEATKVGRGAFYYYIDSKEELLSLIHDRVIVEILSGAERVCALGVSPSETLRLLGRDLLRILTTYPEHVFVHIHELNSLTGERAKQFRAQRRKYQVIVRRVLEQGVESGEFAIDDVHLTTLAWLSLHNYIYVWFRSEGRLTPMAIADNFSQIFIRGISTSVPIQMATSPGGGFSDQTNYRG